MQSSFSWNFISTLSSELSINNRTTILNKKITIVIWTINIVRIARTWTYLTLFLFLWMANSDHLIIVIINKTMPICYFLNLIVKIIQLLRTISSKYFTIIWFYNTYCMSMILCKIRKSIILQPSIDIFIINFYDFVQVWMKFLKFFNHICYLLFI